jgi:hypothetical protein
MSFLQGLVRQYCCQYASVRTHSLHFVHTHCWLTSYIHPQRRRRTQRKTLKCCIYQNSLVKADFTNAILRGASLEDTSMDEAVLENAVAIGSYFSRSILDAANLSNVDFTDASFPPKALALLCQRSDIINGTTNPITGVSTRESLMCP